MYRSSLTLACVVLCAAPAAAADLSSVYVAPGAVYAPSSEIYVHPGPAYRPYAESGYGYRQPYYGTPGYPYRAPASVYGGYGPAAYPEPYYASERYYAHDYAVEYAPRPPLPVPYYRAQARCDDGYGGWTYCN
jgi:hypothetical protein